MRDSKPDKDTLLQVQEEQQEKLERPKMYRVLLHNDDYTPREFVVIVLQMVFQKSVGEANKIMLQAHTKGMATVGIYTYEVASTSVDRVEKISESFGFCLRCTLEAVEI